MGKDSKQKQLEYKLIPLSDIDEEAKQIAIAWVENWKGPNSTVMPDIAQKQKLASDIINYTQKRILIRVEQCTKEIDKLLETKESLLAELDKKKKQVDAFKQWLETAVKETTGPAGKDALQLVLDKVSESL